MIYTVHWLLTRRCNLNCYYCQITKNYKSSPYKKIKYFLDNEIKTKEIIKGLDWFKEYYPNCFHLFYGGEPLLRDDLYEIINYCNKNNIFYTVISNGTCEDLIKTLFSKVEYVYGLTCSIDPIIIKNNIQCNTFDKSIIGLKILREYRSSIIDPVAEITANKNTLKYLYSLVDMLTQYTICSDITVIDNAKNQYYDFSRDNNNLLIYRNNKVEGVFNKIINSGFNIHLPEILPMILNILPSEFDCHIEENVRNLVIDSDGSIRLCLRIRGTETPKKKLFDYINDKYELTEDLINNIKMDKSKYCQKCNWTCPLMTDTNNKLIHLC